MPLAHLLTPALLRKAQELEAQLGHAPQGASYLQAQESANVAYGDRVAVGARPLPSDATSMMDAARGLREIEAARRRQARIDASPTKGFRTPPDDNYYNPDDPRNAPTQAFGAAERAFGPTFAGGMMRGMYTPEHKVQPIPLAPAAKGAAPVATGKLQAVRLPDGKTMYLGAGDMIDERGRAIAPPSQPPGKTPKKIVLPSNPRARVGVNERGEDVDRRGRAIPDTGRSLSYLAQQRDPGFNTLERRPSDIKVTRLEGLLDTDVAGAQFLEQLYGPHLKAMQDNTDDRGRPTDQFPPGYFDGRSDEEIGKIVRGVDALKRLQKGIPI